MTNQQRWSELKTAIPGLDQLLKGGLKIPLSEKLIILIKGRPGSGKTTLALQMAIGATAWAMDDATQCCYCTCEQEKKDIEDKIIALSGKDAGAVGIEINPWIEHEISTAANSADCCENIFNCLPSTLQIANDITRWLNKPKNGSNDKARLLVVDGLNLLNDEELATAEIEQLIAAMRDKCRVGIIIFESKGRDYDNVDFQSDLVIELRSTERKDTSDYFLTHLSITKSRFQSSVLGWHQYKIRNTEQLAVEQNDEPDRYGIEVFPSIHYILTQHKTLQKRVSESIHNITSEQRTQQRRERRKIYEQSFLFHALKLRRNRKALPSGDPEDFTIEQLEKHYITNLKEGSCTVLLGPRRSWKTQITFNFLKSASINGESGLLVSLIDNQGRLVSPNRCICDKYCIQEKKKDRLKHRNCLENVYLLQMPPGCVTASEFFFELERRLAWAEEEDAKTLADGNPTNKPLKRIRRLVFWDLAQLEYRFPLLYADPMFLPGLMNYLKYTKIANMDCIPAEERENHDEMRHITSLFMGASNSEIARAASAMADNVLFCWQDKIEAKLPLSEYADQNDAAIYVDRIEGIPGKNQLFHIDADSKKRLWPQPIKSNKLVYADDMIASIQQLQGLSGLSVPINRKERMEIEPIAKEISKS